jgi:hypothetical protein
MLAAAARRLVVLFVSLAGSVALIALAIGALAGYSADRSVAVGLDIAGCFLIVAGFFVGSRGPMRHFGGGSQGAPGSSAQRGPRWLSLPEREEGLNASAAFVLLGFLMIVLGLVIDSRVRLL